MNHGIRAMVDKILGRQAGCGLAVNKTELIDFACQRLNMRSFADLGAVWNVDGAYTFYSMERHKIREAVLVDTDMTPAVVEKKRKYSGLRIIRGNFGDRSVLDQIGKVDGVFFFDTLLHQVKPDWNEILQMYSSIARIFLILNQQFINLPATTRLLDMGLEEYSRSVPHSMNEEPYKTYFRDLDAIHPTHGRPYRDIHNIWQWGITDADLLSCTSDLGFKMQFYKNCGQFGQLRGVENHAFILSKALSD